MRNAIQAVLALFSDLRFELYFEAPSAHHQIERKRCLRVKKSSEGFYVGPRRSHEKNSIKGRVICSLMSVACYRDYLDYLHQKAVASAICAIGSTAPPSNTSMPGWEMYAVVKGGLTVRAKSHDFFEKAILFGCMMCMPSNSLTSPFPLQQYV